MRKFILIAILSASLCAVHAATVTSTPGGLHQVATNVNETSLTVSGSIDARDFRYLADNFTALQTLDLQNVTIAAYQSTTPLFGNQYIYPGNAIPLMALADHQSLRQVTLPTSATSIEAGAFAGCKTLTTVTMGNALTAIGDHAFAGCPALVNVTLPASLQTLGGGAFLRCTALKTVKATSNGSTTLRIGDEAFMGCSALTTVTLGAQLATVGARAFAGTGLKTLDLTGHGKLNAVGDFAFVKSAQLSTVKFPTSVTQLGRGAMLYTKVTSVTMPKDLEAIAPYTFAGANQLGTLDLSSLSIDRVGEYALYNASALTNIVVPSTTTYIGTQAMAGMTGLTRINSKAAVVPALGEQVWKGVTQSTVKLMVPNSSLNSYKAAEQWKEFDVQPGILRGDANNDGAVDIGDVNAIINFMLNKPSQEEFFFEGADTDGNGVVDIDDVNYVINVILRRIDPEAAPAVPDTHDLLTIDDLTIASGESRTVAVKLSHLTAYTAMQCDIMLPEGLRVASDGIATTESSASHLVASSVSDGVVRIACYSLQGKNLGEAEDDAVLWLTVEADEALVNGSQIGIENVVLGTATSTVHHCDNSYAQVNTVTAVSDVKAINCRAWAEGSTLFIESDEAAQAQLVAMNGTSTTLAVMQGRNAYDGIEPGFYVVRLAGSTYKVVIK